MIDDATAAADTPHVRNEDTFAAIPQALLYDPDICAEAVRVYGVLRRHGNDPANCYPSHKRIAAFIGRSASSVPTWIRQLEKAGWVERVARFTVSGDPDSNGYIVYGRARQQGVRAEEQAPSTPADREGSALGNTPKESHVEREPLNEVEPATLDSALVLASAPIARATFDDFWTAYPYKVGKPKAEAAYTRAVRRCGGDPVPIIEGTFRYRDDPNRDDEFTAHPTTWLNRDGWNDPPLPQRRNGNAVEHNNDVLANFGRREGVL